MGGACGSLALLSSSSSLLLLTRRVLVSSRPADTQHATRDAQHTVHVTPLICKQISGSCAASLCLYGGVCVRLSVCLPVCLSAWWKASICITPGAGAVGFCLFFFSSFFLFVSVQIRPLSFRAIVSSLRLSPRCPSEVPYTRTHTHTHARSLTAISIAFRRSSGCGCHGKLTASQVPLAGWLAGCPRGLCD